MAYKQDIEVSNEVWVDVHTATGISAGAQVTIQNLGNEGIRIYEGTSAPTTRDIGLYVAAIRKDRELQQLAEVECGGSNVAWVISAADIGNSKISVQEV